MTEPTDHRNEIVFDRTPVGPPGALVRLSPLVRRMVAGNAGPMTFTGTCTYVVGSTQVAVVDPGPENLAHIAALLDALRGETIVAILVTHTHNDHSPGARLLKDATGARIYGCPPYAEPSDDDAIGLCGTHDLAHAPDVAMHANDAIEGPGFTLACVETPGHTTNHRSFALPQEHALFSGDHVMAWSTSVVAPPDGDMGSYMESLDRLGRRDDRLYWPGHGGPVVDPRAYVRALSQHRKNREAAILACVTAKGVTIDTIVTSVYVDLDPGLRRAASLSVLAHLESLVARGLAVTEGIPRLDACFRRA
jgi:glyoxylase-like metal-dependent hydrolase (beta-lactamase superfamily II)